MLSKLAYRKKRKGLDQHGAWSMVQETTNPATVRYISSNLLRILYLQHLGVTWDRPVVIQVPPSKAYLTDYHGNIITKNYAVTVTRMSEPLDSAVEEDMKDIEVILNGKFKPVTKTEYQRFLRGKPDAFPITRSAIEWGFKHFKKIYLDNQVVNYRQCPITGYIYPYDTLNVDSMMQYGYLRLPIDRYWQ